jgi:hypothetical protein
MVMFRFSIISIFLTLFIVNCVLAQRTLPPASVHVNPFAEYSANLHHEVKPVNANFYSVYYRNKVAWAFQKFKNDEKTLLLEYDEDDGYSDEEAREKFQALSPAIGKDSTVRNVYIRSNVRRDIYAHDKE